MLDMEELYMEELPGYVTVTRDGPCLDTEDKQVASCAFRHGDENCYKTACHGSERTDGRTVQFYRLHTVKEATNG